MELDEIAEDTLLRVIDVALYDSRETRYYELRKEKIS